MKFPKEQKSALFDGICPYKSMSIVSHEQCDHMIDQLNYLGSPEVIWAHKPPFTPYLPQLKNTLNIKNTLSGVLAVSWGTEIFT